MTKDDYSKFHIIDIKVLIENIGDDVDFIEDMLDAFVTNGIDYLADFEEAHLANNKEVIKLIAHKLLASMKLFGIKEGEELAAYIENSITNNVEEDLESKIAKLDHICHQAIAEANRIIE